MKNTKSDKEKLASKVPVSSNSKTKGVSRTTPSIDGNKENSRTSSKPARQENGSEALHAVSGYSALSEATQAQIAKRAYELYEQRGWQHGDDQADWFQAAKEVLVQEGQR
jgi:hypothetical protein